MLSYTFIKTGELDSEAYTAHLNKAGVVSFWQRRGSEVTLTFTHELNETELDAVLLHESTYENPVVTVWEQGARNTIRNAIEKGQQLVEDFATESIVLGINQANMSGPVRRAMQDVVNSLLTGALYDSVSSIKTVRDDIQGNTALTDVFLSDTRLLKYLNELEAFLGLPLTESF